MKWMIVSLVLAVLLVMPIASAEIHYTPRCDGNVLVREANFTIGEDVYVLNQTEFCPYGCDNNIRACAPPPVQGYIIALVIVLILFGIGGAIMKYS